MASNIATQNLMKMLPSNIPVTQIADDVYAISPAHKAQAAEIFKNQPSIKFFLERDLRASRTIYNLDKAGMWRLHPLVSKVDNRNNPIALMAMLEGKQITEDVEPLGGGSSLGKAKLRSLVSPVLIYTPIEIAGGQWFDKIKIRYTSSLAGFTHLEQVEWVGVMVPSNITEHYVDQAAIDMRSNPAYYVDVTDPRNAGYTVTVTNFPAEEINLEETFRIESKITLSDDERRPPALQDLVVIAGPATCEYAEFYDNGFAWICASMQETAARLDKVIAHYKTKPGWTAAQTKDFDEQREKMALMPQSLVLFKGCADFDPTAMWRLAREMNQSVMSGDVSIDGVNTDTASTNSGREDWKSGKWMLTILGADSVASSLISAIPPTPGAVAIKPSGDEKVHLTDGAGTVDITMIVAAQLVQVYLSKGYTITYTENDFNKSLGFSTVQWEALRATTADTTFQGVSGLTTGGAISGLGEAICVRLLTPSLVDKDEEAVVLPAMSPQYFWTDYARA